MHVAQAHTVYLAQKTKGQEPCGSCPLNRPDPPAASANLYGNASWFGTLSLGQLKL